MYDAVKGIYNPVNARLFADLPSVEVTGTLDIDILSNGFKVRNTHAVWNTNTGTYVGIAYAEMAGKWSNAR